MVFLSLVCKRKIKMFFDKKNKIDIKKRHVAVIGTSPLALFLIDLLLQNNIDVAWMSGIAKKDKNNEYIKTVWGVGYKFVKVTGI